MHTSDSNPNFLRSLLAVVILAGMFFAAGSLAGCNTTAGVGRDIEAAGSGLENAAEKAK